jgi:hypothetical protein
MMGQAERNRMTAEARAGGASPLLWFGIVVAAAVLLSLAVVAVNSGGLDRLLPNDELFVPYFTT